MIVIIDILVSVCRKSPIRISRSLSDRVTFLLKTGKRFRGVWNLSSNCLAEKKSFLSSKSRSREIGLFGVINHIIGREFRERYGVIGDVSHKRQVFVDYVCMYNFIKIMLNYFLWPKYTWWCIFGIKYIFFMLTYIFYKYVYFL